MVTSQERRLARRGLSNVLRLLRPAGRDLFLGQLRADLSGALARIDLAMLAGDAMALRRAAHDLTALAGVIGAAEVERAARTLHDRAERPLDCASDCARLELLTAGLIARVARRVRDVRPAPGQAPR